MTGYLRPDERAANAKTKRVEGAKRLLEGGIKGVAGAAAGTALASKVLPWLSEYIPTDLAMKGLNKISPKLGEILRKGQEAGLDLKEGFDFIKSKAEPKEEETPKENRSIIEQYSPELHQFLDQEIKKGRDVLQAGALAQNDKRFMKIIDKIQKDHKTPWSAILQSVFGGGPSQATQSQQATPTRDLLRQQGQQQQPQQGGLDPELASLLQQGNSILSKFRGNRG